MSFRPLPLKATTNIVTALVSLGLPLYAGAGGPVAAADEGIPFYDSERPAPRKRDPRELSHALQALRDGMPARDVLDLLGPPDEKMDHETSRQSYWRYGDRTVVLHAGKVRQPETAQMEPTPSGAQGAASPGGKRRGPITPLDAKRTAAIFKDMMREIPSEDAATPKEPGQPVGAPMLRGLNRPDED